MKTLDAQQDMRFGYMGGGPGIFVSGLVWLVAGIVALTGEQNHAVWTLLIGGALIAPVSGVLTKLFGRPDKASPGNPLLPLAVEGTIWFICCLPLAYVISRTHPEWFFPAMLLVVGGRYLTFQSLFGMRIYWILGALLAASANFIVLLDVPFAFQPFACAVIEIVIAPIAWKRGKNESPLDSSTA